MKALLVKTGDELKKIFKELTNQMNSMQPDNIQQKKVRLVFKKELFYDVRPSERLPSWVDVTFVFNEENYGEKEVPISVPGQFFVYYNDLDKYNLPLFGIEDLNRIREYAEDEENYTLCSSIKDVIQKIQ